MTIKNFQLNKTWCDCRNSLPLFLLQCHIMQLVCASTMIGQTVVSCVFGAKAEILELHYFSSCQGMA